MIIFLLQSTRGRMQSSSSLFRKFASEAVGVRFRKPQLKDETAKKASSIFNKYASSVVDEEEKEEEEVVKSTSQDFEKQERKGESL